MTGLSHFIQVLTAMVERPPCTASTPLRGDNKNSPVNVSIAAVEEGHRPASTKKSRIEIFQPRDVREPAAGTYPTKPYSPLPRGAHFPPLHPHLGRFPRPLIQSLLRREMMQQIFNLLWTIGHKMETDPHAS